MEVSLEKLDALIEKSKQLKELLEKNPQILAYLKLIQGMEKDKPLLVVKAEGFVEIKEAAAMLRVSPNKIAEYNRQGLLTAYKVPDSGHNRYKLSDVVGLAKEVS